MWCQLSSYTQHGAVQHGTSYSLLLVRLLLTAYMCYLPNIQVSEVFIHYGGTLQCKQPYEYCLLCLEILQPILLCYLTADGMLWPVPLLFTAAGKQMQHTQTP